MFTVSNILKKPQKFTFDQKDIIESAKKYNKLMIETNEDIKRKKEIQNLLYGNTVIKHTNHSVNDLIYNAKYRNFIFIVSFVSLGALFFYKSK
jgi:hypothetical protein